MSAKPLFLGLIAFLALSEPRIGSAGTWYVNKAAIGLRDGKSLETGFETIQEGIEAAAQGDEVIVAEETYVENIQFKAKNVSLRSTDPLDPDIVAATIIDGNHAGPVVTFTGTEDETCLLSGFTVRNGSAGSGAGIAGGEGLQRNRAIIQNNHISGNSAQLYGGGMAYCDGKIQNNTITLNSAADGGGLAHCDGLIRNNNVTSNSAVGTFPYGSGGGLLDCGGTIHGNTISGNSAAIGGGLVGCQGIIENNTIASNSAAYDGGGLLACNGTVRNNAIAANSARHGSGGGLYDCFGTIANNTLTGNSASSGGGFYGCDAVILNCIVWGNTASWVDPQICSSRTPTYSCIQDWSAGGEGNTTDDPKFADADGPDDIPDTYEDNNYRLSGESPCIDKGKNEDWMSSATDLGGDPRIINGTVDMGAYEYFAFKVVEVSVAPDGQARLTWTSRPADTYVVRSCLDLINAQWNPQQPMASQGELTSWTDPDKASYTRKFYRVEALPSQGIEIHH